MIISNSKSFITIIVTEKARLVKRDIYQKSRLPYILCKARRTDSEIFIYLHAKFLRVRKTPCKNHFFMIK
jgi:hypothetical protein